MIDAKHERPKEQWWLEMKGIATLLAKLGPEVEGQNRTAKVRET
jgi:hypothetical protein